MAIAAGGVIIDNPRAETFTVNLTATSGASLTVYTDVALTSAASLPYTGTDTSYALYVDNEDSYTLSVLCGGVEMAGTYGNTLAWIIKDGAILRLNPFDDPKITGFYPALGTANTFAAAQLVKPSSNTTTAFRVQNAAGSSTVLDVDTTNGRVGVMTATPAVALDVVGAIANTTTLAVGTNATVGGTLAVTGAVTHTSTLAQNDHLTMADAKNIVVNATTGTKIGTATTQKLGFYNATPVVQPSAYTQTYSTADKTHANVTQAALTHAVGTADGTVDDVGGAFNQTTLNNNFKEVTTALGQAAADILDLKQLVNAVIDDLQALGLVG